MFSAVAAVVAVVVAIDVLMLMSSVILSFTFTALVAIDMMCI